MIDRNSIVEFDFKKLLGFQRLKLTGCDQATLGAAFNKAGGELPPLNAPPRKAGD